MLYMHRTTIYLDDEIRQRVQSLAQTEGVTQAAIIRRAVRTYVLGRRKTPRCVGLGQSGRGDLSDRAEELLSGMGEAR